MSNLVRMDALSAAEMRTDPFPWAHYENAFSDPRRLVERFPDSGFEPYASRRILEALGKHGTDAWYDHNVKTRALLEFGSSEPREADDLDEAWVAVAEDLCSPAYRECLSDVTGLDVRDLPMQAHFWQFMEGATFKPHVDKPHKIVTHLFYLADEWHPGLGGCFQVLRSSDPGDVHTEIPPVPNDSIVLRRTDEAWHAVSPIPRGTDRTRKVLQIWFWGE